MNLISFNKNFNINELLSELENSIIEDKNKKYKNYEYNIINGNIKYKDSYKVVFVGGPGIGAKTSLIKNIVSNTFNEISNVINGTNKTKTVITKDGRRINLELWDTAGQEKYRALTKFFYKNADCVVLGYDITSKSSFEEIKYYWISDIKSECNPKLMYLIGCKTDLYEYQTVSSEKAKEFAEQNNLRFFEVSNKYKNGINEFIEDLANQIIIE